MMSRRINPPLRGRIDDCTGPFVMTPIKINQVDVREESIDELLALKSRCELSDSTSARLWCSLKQQMGPCNIYGLAARHSNHNLLARTP